MVTLEVGNPVAESFVPKVDMAPRPTDLDGLRIGLFWNFKPGGDDGLDRAEVLLQERYPNATFVRVFGSAGATPKHLTPADSEHVLTVADVVVGTTGD